MSPTLELQGAITPALKTAVSSLVSNRVYDEPPRGPNGEVSAKFPFIAHGVSDELQDDADCVDGVEVTYEVDCWSRSPGYVEALQMADLVHGALHRASLSLTTNALVFIEHVQTRKFRDPDGKTSRAICQFRAVIETP